MAVKKEGEQEEGETFLSNDKFNKGRKIRLNAVGLRNWDQVLAMGAQIGCDHTTVMKTHTKW